MPGDLEGVMNLRSCSTHTGVHYLVKEERALISYFSTLSSFSSS